jgi:putative addiction module component (TIGR02574 family)
MNIAIQDFKQLPVSERIQIVEDFWDTIAEDADTIGLNPAHQEELDRRLDALEALPEDGTPWNIARERILASL